MLDDYDFPEGIVHHPHYDHGGPVPPPDHGGPVPTPENLEVIRKAIQANHAQLKTLHKNLAELSQLVAQTAEQQEQLIEGSQSHGKD